MRLLTLASGLVLFSALCNVASGQSAARENYVTIGVFGQGKQEYAVRFTDHASKMGFTAQYAINPKRKLYYVFLLQTDDFKKAVSFMIRLRAESEFKDAWVFVGNLGEEHEVSKHVEAIPVRTATEATGTVVTAPALVDPVTKPGEQPAATEQKIIAGTDSTATSTTKPAVKKVAKGKFFTFEFLNNDNGNVVRGEVHVQESKYAKQYQAYKANEMIDLLHPRNKDGIYFIRTIAPGYKTFETIINYKDPSSSIAETGPDGELMVPIHLIRAKRGDYIEFSSVGFHRNSVIMQPAFQVELDGLVDLMKEHMNYRLRIHGHCNGEEPRSIVTLGKSPKFFESDVTNGKKTASARELTDLRAEAAKGYLVFHGISADRLETKGEGGKMMVYPSNSVYANYNDRIEMEIIRH